MSEIDDGLAQRGVDLVVPAIGDEGLVELELLERHFLRLGERRVGPAKIVDCKPDVVRLKLLAQFAGKFEVVDDLLFGQVDDQARPFLAGRAVRLDNVFNRKSSPAPAPEC